MKLLVINGPNLNMLGIRERALYGAQDYAALCDFVRAQAGRLGVSVELFQSNHEGAIVDRIQAAYQNIDGIVIWQSSAGEVFQTQPGAEPVKLAASICEYLNL